METIVPDIVGNSRWNQEGTREPHFLCIAEVETPEQTRDLLNKLIVINWVIRHCRKILRTLLRFLK